MREKITIVSDKLDAVALLQQLNDPSFTADQISIYPSLSELAAANIDIDAVLVNIPDLGVSFFDELRELSSCFSKAPIILITTSGDTDKIKNAIHSGVDDYLVIGKLDADMLKRSILCCTEQKALNGKAHKSVDNNSIFDESPTPMWVYESETHRIMAVNDAAIKQYGYSREEFLELTIFDIRPPEELELVRKELNRPKPAGGYYDAGIWKHMQKDGTTFYVRVYSQAIHFYGFNSRVIIAVNVDTSVLAEQENQELHRTLEQQRQQYEAILSSLTEVVWAINAEDHQLTYCNNACTHVFGYTPQEMKDDKELFLRIIHPDDKQILSKAYYEAVKYGRSVYTFRIIHRDGTTRYISGTTVFRAGSNGERHTFSGLGIDITEQVLIDEQLKEKAKEVEEILETITDAFYTVDSEWRLTYINNVAEKLYGIKKETHLGTDVWDVFANSKKTDFYEQYVRAMTERVSAHFTAYSPSTKKWILVNAYPNNDGLAIYHTDVTEQKRLEDKVVANEQNLRAIINNTKDIIWSIDEQFQLITANDAYYERVKEMTNEKEYSELTETDFDKAVLDEWQGYYKRAFDGEQFRITYGSVRKGIQVYEEINFNPILDANKKITGVSFFSRDITEEKKLENKIMKDKQNLAALINNTTDMIWSVDRDISIISANNAYKNHIERLCGIRPQAGTQVLEHISNYELFEQWKQYYLRALEGPFYVIDEETYDNATTYVETYFNPITDTDENIIGVSCFSRDITLQRDQMLRIQKHNEQLKEIAWIQSHKVRAPLANILGLAQLFNLDDYNDPANGDVVNGIIKAANTLDDIIREVVRKANDIL